MVDIRAGIVINLVVGVWALGQRERKSVIAMVTEEGGYHE